MSPYLPRLRRPARDRRAAAFPALPLAALHEVDVVLARRGVGREIGGAEEEFRVVGEVMRDWFCRNAAALGGWLGHDLVDEDAFVLEERSLRHHEAREVACAVGPVYDWGYEWRP